MQQHKFPAEASASEGGPEDLTQPLLSINADDIQDALPPTPPPGVSDNMCTCEGHQSEQLFTWPSCFYWPCKGASPDYK